MTTNEFFQAGLDSVVDTHHPLAVLDRRMSWSDIEGAPNPKFDRKDRKGRMAVQPVVDDTKADHQMDRGWMKAAEGDTVRIAICATSFNTRWLMRASVAQATNADRAFFFPSSSW